MAQLLGIDQALISKFERGARKHTREQIIKLASLLEIDLEIIMVYWLKEKFIHEIGQEEFAPKAILLAEEGIRCQNKVVKQKISTTLQKIVDEIDILKSKLDSFHQFGSYRITQALELKHTFESNRIKGNTMTLGETDLVINEGLTVSGKSMREHLEVINHQEAIAYIKDFTLRNSFIRTRNTIYPYSYCKGDLP